MGDLTHPIFFWSLSVSYKKTIDILTTIYARTIPLYTPVVRNGKDVLDILTIHCWVLLGRKENEAETIYVVVIGKPTVVTASQRMKYMFPIERARKRNTMISDGPVIPLLGLLCTTHDYPEICLGWVLGSHRSLNLCNDVIKSEARLYRIVCCSTVDAALAIKRAQDATRYLPTDATYRWWSFCSINSENYICFGACNMTESKTINDIGIWSLPGRWVRGNVWFRGVLMEVLRGADKMFRFLSSAVCHLR